jgi:hypothetical protein
MCDTEQAPQSKWNSRRYRVNLALLLVLVGLSTYWFYEHVHLYFTQSVFVGGTLTIWGLWKIVQSVLKVGVGDKGPKAARLLNTAGAKEYLILGISIVLLLYVTTSSLYLVYQGSQSGQAQFDVDILAGDTPYLPTVTVASYDRVHGQPFFFRVKPVELQFAISNEPGYATLSRTLYPWTTVRLRVPADFPVKQYHVVRLVPGRRVFQNLPRPTDVAAVSYFLKVVVRGNTYTQREVHQGSLYLGAGQVDLKRLARQAREKGSRQIEDYYAALGMPQERARGLATTLEDRAMWLGTEELQPGDQITLRLVRVGQPDTALVDTVITIADSAGVQTAFLEAPQ